MNRPGINAITIARILGLSQQWKTNYLSFLKFWIFSSNFSWAEGGVLLCSFHLKNTRVWMSFFLWSSRSSTDQLHYPQGQVTADLLLMATCEQQKLSPGTLRDCGSGQHLLPVPTNTCICRRDWRLWLNWVPVGWEPLVYKKNVNFLFWSPRCTQHFWSFPSWHREMWPLLQRCPAVFTEHFQHPDTSFQCSALLSPSSTFTFSC